MHICMHRYLYCMTLLNTEHMLHLHPVSIASNLVGVCEKVKTNIFL